jgi:uncharacterized protein
MISSIFVNLPIADLKRSVEFFSGLGFEFNQQFTSEDTTCMIIGENMYAMFLLRNRFKTFVDKPVATAKTCEVLVALLCESTDEVKRLTERAFELGARRYKEPEDLGFMYSWGFEDLDGHIWELGWMDPEHVE